MARAVGRGVPLIIMIGFILVNSIVRIINRCGMCNGRFGVYSWTSLSTERVWIYTWNGQSSRSYLDHECTRHIVSWWYIHVPNMVSQCQTIKKLWAGHESAQTDGQTDGRTDTDRQTDRQSDFYIPPWTSFAGGIIKGNINTLNQIGASTVFLYKNFKYEKNLQNSQM